MNKKTIRNIGIFIFIVIISGWIGVLVDSALVPQPEGDSLGMGSCNELDRLVRI